MIKKLALLFGVLLCAAVIYSRTQTVIGPFLFGDEESYFSMIRTFATEQRLTTSQYGPLYPVLMSFLFDAENPQKSYEWIRLFNLLVFSLSFLPIFLLARQLKISFTESYLLALTSVLLPWSAYPALIWAEPLYYSLYCWCWYFAERALRTRENSDYLILGLFSALLILTKQLGIAFIAGFGLVRMISAIRAWDQRKSLVRHGMIYLLPFLIPISFFIWNKMTQPTAGLMGYSNATSAIQNSLLDLILSPTFYSTIGHQLSYLIVASFGLPFICVLFFCFRWKNISYSEHHFAILILSVALAISSLISLFFNTLQQSYQIPNEPQLTNGRYLAPLIPIFLIWSYRYLQIYRRFFFHKINLTLIVLMSLCVAFFSPLTSVYALGIANSPDTMFLSRIFNEIYPPWSAKTALEWADKFAFQLAIYFLVLVIALWTLSRFRYVYLSILLTLSILNSDVSSRNVRYLGDVTESENKLILYLLERKIPLDQVFYDKTVTVDEFKYKFWYGIPKATEWFNSHSVEHEPQKGWLITSKKTTKDPRVEVQFANYELINFGITSKGNKK